MESVKKYSIQTIAIIVLSVLLAISVAVGGTMAWFADRDAISGSMTMGQAVLINIADNDDADATTMTFNFPSDGAHGYVVPSMPVAVDSTVRVQKSNTPVYLRALITVDVKSPEGTTIPEDKLTMVKDQFWNEISKLANGGGWFQADDSAQPTNAFGKDTTTINNQIGDYFYLTENVGRSYEAHASGQYATAVPQNTATDYLFVRPEDDTVDQTYKAASVSTKPATTELYRVYVDDVVLGADEYLEIALLYGYMAVPKDWDNTVAEAVITFNIQVEAIQAIIYDNTGTNENLLTKIEDVCTAFDDAKAQDDSVNTHDPAVGA